jgi:aminoglycoside/choline kinase family phosphotransferase
VVGVINRHESENNAFVALAAHFKSEGLPVPEVFLYKCSLGAYLEQDLGDTTLLGFLSQERTRTGLELPDTAMSAYMATVAQVTFFQIRAACTLNFDICFPRGASYAQALTRDLRLFVSDFVARLLPAFDCKSLHEDFSALVAFLSQPDDRFFLYGDLQARNVMLCNGVPYFIDFQGGMRGPLHYDVVSLLHQISAKIPEPAQQHLLAHYISCASALTPLDDGEFFRFYPAFVVSRMLQVLGVYGRQGLGAGKEYFSSSIPGALATLHRQLVAGDFPLNLPNLLACTSRLMNAIPNASNV